MPSKYWIKLYHEILDDPKMGRLPDRLWRRTIEIFLLAGDLDCDGALPTVADMAWRLRADPADLEADLIELATVGIVTRQDDGQWIVTQFAERQAPVSAAERGQRFRERQRRQEYYDTPTEPERDANGAFADTDTESDTESDTDTELEPENADADAGASEPPTPTTFREWHELVTESSNPNATLRYMHETLFPGRKPPDYAYLGRVARQVGGPGRLADLLWQCAPRPPTGEILPYCIGIAKGQREPDKPPEPAGFEGIRRFRERMDQHGDNRRNNGDPDVSRRDLPALPDDRAHGGGVRDGPG